MAEQKYVLAALTVHHSKLAKKYVKASDGLAAMDKEEATKLLETLKGLIAKHESAANGSGAPAADDSPSASSSSSEDKEETMSAEKAPSKASPSKPTPESASPSKQSATSKLAAASKSAASKVASAVVNLPNLPAKQATLSNGNPADDSSDDSDGPGDASVLHALLNKKLEGKAIFKDKGKAASTEAAASKTADKKGKGKRAAPASEPAKLKEAEAAKETESAAIVLPTPTTPAEGAAKAELFAPESSKKEKKDKSSKKRKAPADKEEAKPESAVVTLETIVPPASSSEPVFKKAKIDVTPAAEGKKDNKSKEKNAPFRRVRTEDVQVDERLKDNSYAAIGLDENDFGAKASRDLIVTRGDSFRKEKTKKKRGSYKGGDISMESKSIKFD